MSIHNVTANKPIDIPHQTLNNKSDIEILEAKINETTLYW